MEEKFFLEECPICRGPGMLMHEGGWNVQVECADCSAHTVYVEYNRRNSPPSRWSSACGTSGRSSPASGESNALSRPLEGLRSAK